MFSVRHRDVVTASDRVLDICLPGSDNVVFSVRHRDVECETAPTMFVALATHPAPVIKARLRRVNDRRVLGNLEVTAWRRVTPDEIVQLLHEATRRQAERTKHSAQMSTINFMKLLGDRLKERNTRLKHLLSTS